MSQNHQRELGKILWAIAGDLRGAMNADDFRDYMLVLLFLRYLSFNYEQAARKELGNDYPSEVDANNQGRSPLSIWYEKNKKFVSEFETQMRLKSHYIIRPEHLWSSIAQMARTQDDGLLKTLGEAFDYIENQSFESTFSGLFSEINLNSDKLGKNYDEKNLKLCTIVSRISDGLAEMSLDSDALGDAYEYLISQFAAGSGRRAGEFYTPQPVSDVISAIVTLDGQEPKSGSRKSLPKVMDFACGSGSLLLNLRKRMGPNGVGKIFGQEKNITTYNLARMNMLLHGVKDSEFEIFHGDTLKNEWDILREGNPAKRPVFDAILANPPFGYRWAPNDEATSDFRFTNYGVAPKAAADFAFLLHGFHYLKEDGVMAIILPHGVLFRGRVEARIREKLIGDGSIDTIIGLPPKLFYSTPIPVCILVLKRCKKADNVLFIDASAEFSRIKKQNFLDEKHIKMIVKTYQERPKEVKGYARCVDISEIEANDFNLSIPRYVSSASPENDVDLRDVFDELRRSSDDRRKARNRHNGFLRQLGLPSIR